jgi:hypothetical protein
VYRLANLHVIYPKCLKVKVTYNTDAFGLKTGICIIRFGIMALTQTLTEIRKSQ